MFNSFCLGLLSSKIKTSGIVLSLLLPASSKTQTLKVFCCRRIVQIRTSRPAVCTQGSESICVRAHSGRGGEKEVGGVRGRRDDAVAQQRHRLGEKHNFFFFASQAQAGKCHLHRAHTKQSNNQSKTNTEQSDSLLHLITKLHQTPTNIITRESKLSQTRALHSQTSAKTGPRSGPPVDLIETQILHIIIFILSLF